MAKRIGRPSDYNLETAESICTGVATGRMLAAVCKDPGMPHVATVYRWFEAHAEFREMYARAKDVQMDVIAADTLRIADEIIEGKKCKRVLDAKGGETIEEQTGDMVERARLMVDTRKWLLAKLAPRKYGDRVQLAGDPDAPLVTQTWADVLRERRAKRAAESVPRETLAGKLDYPLKSSTNTNLDCTPCANLD